MKYYILLSSRIGGIGGSMIYQLNKLRYYKNKGYTVSLFHFDINNDDVKINELRVYKNNCLAVFSIHPAYLRKRSLKKAVNFIKNKISYDNQGDIIFESDGVKNIYWGEYLAKVFNGKHIILILGEKQIIRNKYEFEFCFYKLKRNELFSISKSNTQYFFKNWINLPLENSPALLAYCANCLEDLDYLSHHKIKKTDYTIGSIGRLEKSFLLKNLKEVRRFTNLYADKSFTILLIGGSDNPIYEFEINKLFQKCKNVQVYITGNIYPIPVELVRLGDVFISQAGSVSVSKKLGIPTIRCCIIDDLPISIENEGDPVITNRDENHPILNVQEALESILFKKKYSKLNIYFDTDKENNIDFSDHDYAILRSNEDHNYYDVINKKKGIRTILNKACIFFIGVSNYINLRTWKQNLLKHRSREISSQKTDIID